MNVPSHFYNIFIMSTVAVVHSCCAARFLASSERAVPGAAPCPGPHLLPLFSPLFPPPPGTLLATYTCSASSELPSRARPDFLTEGASAHLSVPGNPDDILSASWFRGHEARPEAMIFSPEGLPGPGHSGREMLDTQGSLLIRNVTAEDSGSYTVVLKTSRGRRSATEQIQVQGEWGPAAGEAEVSVGWAHPNPLCAGWRPTAP